MVVFQYSILKTNIHYQTIANKTIPVVHIVTVLFSYNIHYCTNMSMHVLYLNTSDKSISITEHCSVTKIPLRYI